MSETIQISMYRPCLADPGNEMRIHDLYDVWDNTNNINTISPKLDCNHTNIVYSSAVQCTSPARQTCGAQKVWQCSAVPLPRYGGAIAMCHERRRD